MRTSRLIFRLPVAVLFVSMLAFAAGCSIRVYSRAMDGAGPHREIEPGARVAVLPADAASADPATAAKIERLLVQQGFRAAPVCEADFAVLYHYALASSWHRRSIEPLTGPASGIRSAIRPGPYDHTVHVRVVEAGPWLSSGEERVVWAGVAQVSDAPTAGVRFLDMALLCALDDFNEVTDATVATKMRVHDRRVRELD